MEIYFNATGTINRMTYFRHTMVIIGIVLIVIFLTILFGVLEKISPYSPIGYLMTMPALIIFYYALLVLTIKRLRDIGKSGWWSVIMFVPYISTAFYLILLFVKGKGSNFTTVN
jgi:uncharacterized membrane protein YhaH (DUF805 family)